MFGRPKGSLKILFGRPSRSFRLNCLEVQTLPEIFSRAQPCSPLVIGSMIHYMLLLNVEVHFLDNISKGNANSNRTTHILNIYGGTIDVRFVLSSKGTLLCNSSFSVLVLNRTSHLVLNFLFVIQHTGNSCLHQHIPR